MKPGWKNQKLKDCVDLLAGYPFKSSLFTDDPQDVPLVKGENIQQGYIDWNIAKRWNVAEFNNLKKFHLTSGDVVIAMDRPWVPAGLKYSWIRKNDPPSLLVQRVSRLRASKELNQDYLRYIVGSRNFCEYLKKIVTGVNIPHISGNQILSFEFYLPPLSVQKKIAGILSAYDDLIENNRRRIKILEEMARNLYREWFVKFRFPIYRPDGSIERFHNPESDPMQDSPLGSIPKNWKPAVLGDICKENRISASPENFPKDTPYIGLEHMPRRSITLSEWGKLDDVISTKLLYKKGEILFGKIRPYFHKVGIALTDGLCSSDAIVINPLNKIHFGQVLCCVSSDDFVAQAAKSSQGTKMPRANWNIMTQYSCPLPEDYLSFSFSQQISLFVNQCGSLALKNKNLQQTRDLLLPKLISGEIEV